MHFSQVLETFRLTTFQYKVGGLFVTSDRGRVKSNAFQSNTIYDMMMSDKVRGFIVTHYSRNLLLKYSKSVH